MSNRERIARREQHERRICSGSRAIEWILIAMAFWAGLVMGWTPTALRHSPPPFYRVINDSFEAWVIGFVLAIVPVVHGAGLLLSRCRCVDPCEINCPRERVGALLRTLGAKGQVGIWAFLTTIYVLLWAQRGEVTFGSGACVILLVCASISSYCISKEHSRRRAREEAQQFLARHEGKPKTEILQLLGEWSG